MKHLPIEEFSNEIARETLHNFRAKGGRAAAKKLGFKKAGDRGRKGMANRWKGHIIRPKALRKNFPCPHCVERLKNNPNLKMS